MIRNKFKAVATLSALAIIAALGACSPATEADPANTADAASTAPAVSADETDNSSGASEVAREMHNRMNEDQEMHDRMKDDGMADDQMEPDDKRGLKMKGMNSDTMPKDKAEPMPMDHM